MLKAKVCKYHCRWYLKESTQISISLWLLELWSEYIVCTLHLRANLYAATHASSPQCVDVCCAAFISVCSSKSGLFEPGVSWVALFFRSSHSYENQFLLGTEHLQKLRVVTFELWIRTHSQVFLWVFCQIFCHVGHYKTFQKPWVMHTSVRGF